MINIDMYAQIDHFPNYDIDRDAATKKVTLSSSMMKIRKLVQ